MRPWQNKISTPFGNTPSTYSRALQRGIENNWLREIQHHTRNPASAQIALGSNHEAINYVPRFENEEDQSAAMLTLFLRGFGRPLHKGSLGGKFKLHYQNMYQNGPPIQHQQYQPQPYPPQPHPPQPHPPQPHPPQPHPPSPPPIEVPIDSPRLLTPIQALNSAQERTLDEVQQVLNQRELDLIRPNGLPELFRHRQQSFITLTEKSRVVGGTAAEWREYWRVCQRTLQLRGHFENNPQQYYTLANFFGVDRQDFKCYIPYGEPSAILTFRNLTLFERACTNAKISFDNVGICWLAGINGIAFLAHEAQANLAVDSIRVQRLVASRSQVGGAAPNPPAPSPNPVGPEAERLPVPPKSIDDATTADPFVSKVSKAFVQHKLQELEHCKRKIQAICDDPEQKGEATPIDNAETPKRFIFHKNRFKENKKSLSFLGEGYEGKVLLGKQTNPFNDKKEDWVAIKMCDIDKSKFGANEAELAIIMRERGQNSRAHLVDFYAVDPYSNDDGEYILITMELGIATINDRLKSLPKFHWQDGEKMHLIKRVAQGVRACHDCGIRHRDVRPENVLIMPRGSIKLSDFGFSRLEKINASGMQSKLETVTTADLLQPQEVYLAAEENRKVVVHIAGDIFMAGATMAIIARDGKLPFHDTKPDYIRQAIIDGRPPDNVIKDLENEPLLLHLILWALDHDAEKRPSSMLDIEGHPYFWKYQDALGFMSRFRQDLFGKHESFMNNILRKIVQGDVWQKRGGKEWASRVPDLVKEIITGNSSLYTSTGTQSIKNAIRFVRNGMMHLYQTLKGPHGQYPQGKFPNGMTMKERDQLLTDKSTGMSWKSVDEFFLRHSCCAWLLAELYRAEKEVIVEFTRWQGELDREPDVRELEEEEKKESD